MTLYFPCYLTVMASFCCNRLASYTDHPILSEPHCFVLSPSIRRLVVQLYDRVLPPSICRYFVNAHNASNSKGHSTNNRGEKTSCHAGKVPSGPRQRGEAMIA